MAKLWEWLHRMGTLVQLSQTIPGSIIIGMAAVVMTTILRHFSGLDPLYIFAASMLILACGVWAVNGGVSLYSRWRPKTVSPLSPETVQSADVVSKEIGPQVSGLNHAQKRVVLQIIRMRGMNEPQINQYSEKQGFSQVDMMAIQKITTFLTHNFEGQWEVKTEFRNDLEKLLIQQLSN